MPTKFEVNQLTKHLGKIRGGGRGPGHFEPLYHRY